MELRNLKKLCLRFLTLITAASISKVLEQSKLEGLDISGCFNVNLDMTMMKMKTNQTSLKCLLLEYLLIQPFHLSHIRSSKISTLSLFCKQLFNNQYLDCRTVTDSHLDVLRQINYLKHLNIRDCPKISEEGNTLKFYHIHYRYMQDVRGKSWRKVLSCASIRCYANTRSHAIVAMTRCFPLLQLYYIYWHRKQCFYIKFL